MEAVTEDGSQIRTIPGQTRELGRANGLDLSDRTISRRHLSFFIPRVSKIQEINLQFEVLGRNPFYVSKDNEVKIFRRFDRGEMGNGDMFCVSAKNPSWYTVREIQNCGEGVRRNDLESELEESSESGFGFEGAEYLHEEGLDTSHIDPVEEFGFVVEGQEFDCYPKKMIKNMKNWEWFLEEEGKDSEDDDVGKKGKSRVRRKRKKGAENDDEEWTGDSEDDKVLIDKSMKGGQLPKYKTRSMDHGTSKSRRRSPTRTKNREVDNEDEDEDEDEDDETMGGFIVDDEKLEDEEENGDAEEDDEEADFVDEDEDE